MSTAVIKDLAKSHNKTVKEVEELYKKAKQLAYDKYDKSSGDFYAYSLGILKNMLGVTASVNKAPRSAFKPVLSSLATCPVETMFKPLKTQCNKPKSVENAWFKELSK